jgi:hypothetical protein
MRQYRRHERTRPSSNYQPSYSRRREPYVYQSDRYYSDENYSDGIYQDDQYALDSLEESDYSCYQSRYSDSTTKTESCKRDGNMIKWIRQKLKFKGRLMDLESRTPCPCCRPCLQRAKARDCKRKKTKRKEKCKPC